MKNSYPFTQTLIATAMSLSLLTACSKPSTPVETKSSSVAVVERENSSALTHEYAAFRAQQISDVAYQLSFDLTSNDENFTGKTLVTFNVADNNQAPITIDFELGDIKQVLVNGNAAEYSYEQSFITLPASTFRTGNNSVQIDYTRPYSTNGSGLHKFVDPANGEVYLYTDFQPYDANRLFPHFDQPDLKATFETTVKAPKSWQVISTTMESDVTEKEGSKLWQFPRSAKISSYIYALHAGPFEVWHDTYQDVPLRLFARKSMAQYVKTDEWFIPTKQSFAFFNDYFGIDYPFGKYDQVIVPDYNSGAMENVAAVTFNEAYISRGEKSEASRRGLANTIAHELAHMWFGNLVTMKWWNGLWLNESFATYMANLALDKASDFDQIWDSFYSGTKQWAYRTDQSVTTHAIELPVPNTDDAFSNFDGITYGKGASVLKQLPYLLGEANFRQGVRNYLKEFSYQNTTLDDFINALGKASNRDLTQWSQEWLYQTGLNTIKVDFQCDAGKVTQMSLLQTAPEDYPTIREQRVQIGLYNITDDKLTATKSIPVLYKGEKFVIDDAVGSICPDLVYPNQDDWGYVKVDLDDKSFETLTQHINDINNTTLRLMLWQSLWDSVNDANLSLDKFVNFAINNIGEETDNNIVRKVAGLLGSSTGYLLSAKRNGKAVDSYLDAIESFSWQQLNNAVAGSEQQKIWYGRYVNSARSEEHLERMYRLLNGEVSINGVTIDQDKRWALIANLNYYQYKDYQAIVEREKLLDVSDDGFQSAIYAEVVRPEADVKAKWFDVVVNNPDNLKLSVLKTIMYGLFPGSQYELQKPYNTIIADKIVEYNDTKELGFLSAFASSLTPANCSTESTKLLTQSIARFDGFKPQVTKTYLRSQQNNDRCMRIVEKLPAN